MSFEIRIVEKTFEKRFVGKDWCQVKGDPGAEFGYTPEIEKTVSVTVERFNQTVDELDLIAVIKAVNGIGDVA